MILEIDPLGEEPIYKQLRDQIILGIAQQQLKSGDLLPSVRMLADELGVNPMTVSKAYNLLKEEGYLITDRRNGTIVTERKNFDARAKKIYEQRLALLLAEGYLHQQSKEKILHDVETYLNTYSKGCDES